VALLCASASAFAAAPVAKLTAFSGQVLVRIQGNWGKAPALGMDLYPEDKVVTRLGTAVVTFHDGGKLDINQCSNVEIQQWEEEKGFFTKTKVVKRRIFLYLGKLAFRSGKAGVENSLGTPTAVCGLRGTAGVLSFGADGQAYITFSEGGQSYSIGNFIQGEAPDIPPEVADLNPAQRAAFVAKAASVQAAAAQTMVDQAKASGNPEEVKKAEAQVAAAYAFAAQKAAEEAQAAATVLIQSNPDPQVVEQATRARDSAAQAATQAQAAVQEAVQEGATDPATLVATDPAAIVTIIQQHQESQQPEGTPPPAPPEEGPIYEPPRIEVNAPTFNVDPEDVKEASQ
jgi:pyruvate/2-oxoglutarate dehydrogenase complex dihydrolipoamide acyltransferase (E2) component